MSCLMRCLGLASGAPGPAGQYLAAYDPRTGESVWTLTKADAIKFPSPLDLMQLWQSVHELVPIRAHDGRPNRPLTAFTITVENDA